ncbi:hypothetical protein Tco_1042676 [Tanacetum coccineum]|uniref:Retrovirus-related Pol polyprotein from transposon TNT 1-94 n=1 Tax=Tanacetum coccineum TaxID=301880 RepID=A0ABQ5GK13_9ASTR
MIFEQVEEDAHVILTPILDTQKTNKLVQSSFVSSDFTSKLLNLENPSLADNEIASLMDTTVHHEEPRSQTSSLYTVPVTTTLEDTSVFTITIPPPPPFFNPLPQQATPTLTDFSSVFKFNDRVTNLEKDLSEIKQVGQYAQALSSIPAIVDRYIDNKHRESIQKAIVAHNLDCREEAQAEKRDYIKLVDTSIRAILKEEDREYKTQRSRPTTGSDRGQKKEVKQEASHLKIKEKERKEPSHIVDDSGVQQDQDFDTGNNDEQPANKEVSKDDCQVAHAKEPRTSFDEIMDTSFDFSAFVLNRLNIKDLTQAILVGPAFDLLKGTCKSLTELEYHLEEYHRGRQVIPKDYFINNDLEYLKGRSLSKQYSMSVTKTKAATYKIKWIEDLGPKRQHFYGFATNMSSSKDVYSKKQIIAVTRLTIMKKYDYGYLEEIEVCREDQKLYKFREGDVPRLRL